MDGNDIRDHLFMLNLDIFLSALANGLLTGAVYALIALGLTLIYGVLHIINFAHGATLTLAMFAVFVAYQVFKLDPYIAVFILTPMFFALGYATQRLIISPASHGSDSNILLVTLGLSIIIENGLLAYFRSDTRSIDVPYGFSVIEVGNLFLSTPKVVAFVAAFAVAMLLWLILARTDTGKAIRAVAKEKTGAALCGIDVNHVYAITFGLGTACLAIAACLLMPTFLVNPRIGNAFVLVAFTIVVLGGMGSIGGALAGGLIIGVVESLSGLYFGESLGQIGTFLIFLVVLLLRPTGLFGAKA
ncbi:LivH Branched-chain amino acid ABC-type transport system, permease components [Rhabdaerophilaceae bacterium]